MRSGLQQNNSLAIKVHLIVQLVGLQHLQFCLYKINAPNSFRWFYGVDHLLVALFIIKTVKYSPQMKPFLNPYRPLH